MALTEGSDNIEQLQHRGISRIFIAIPFHRDRQYRFAEIKNFCFSRRTSKMKCCLFKDVWESTDSPTYEK